MSIYYTHLGETERECHYSYQMQNLSRVFLDLISTRQTGVIGETVLQRNMCWFL